MAIAVSRPSAPAAHNYKDFRSIRTAVDVPNLVHIQLNSFEWLKTKGLEDLLHEISPIEDFNGGRFELRFLNHEIREPALSESECRRRETTYSAPLYVTVRLTIKSTGEIKEQPLFFGDMPLMTQNGTFVINGAERVVVSQLVRSPGAYFTTDTDPASGRALCMGKLIPYRGAWVELETSNRDLLSVKVDRKRKAPITTLLRALEYDTDEIIDLFADVDTDPAHQYIRTTLARDAGVTDEVEALLEFYRRLRPGEPPSETSARTLLQNLFFDPRKYDLGRVGRYKLNRRLGLEIPNEHRTLTKKDIVSMMRRMILINNGQVKPDDIDHLGNRRVRAVGELIQNQIRVGLLRMERVVKERMTTQMDPTTTTPRRAHQHPPRRCSRTRILRRIPAVAVHGPDQSPGRTDAQAQTLGAGPGRPFPRTRRVRREGRAPLPLWTHMPHRDPGRAEHRPARIAVYLCAHQRIRVYRNAVPGACSRKWLQTTLTWPAEPPWRTSRVRTAVWSCLLAR